MFSSKLGKASYLKMILLSYLLSYIYTPQLFPKLKTGMFHNMKIATELSRKKLPCLAELAVVAAVPCLDTVPCSRHLHLLWNPARENIY